MQLKTKPRIQRRTLVIIAAIAALVAGILGTTTAANADPPPPHGTVVGISARPLSGALADVAIAIKVVYTSQDVLGNPIIVSGAILTPKLSVLLAHPEGYNKTVLWGHGTYGPADRCAPSASSVLDAPGDDSISQRLVAQLEQGWTVAITDYQGLGTPGDPTYLVLKAEAQAMLDSGRAARHLNPFLSTDMVISGHSQGGQAALGAAEQASYTPELNIKGVLPVAPASNLDMLATNIPGTEGNGYAVQAVFGLAAADPTVDPSQVLTPAALAQANVLTANNACSGEYLVAYAGFSAADLLIGGAFSQTIVDKLNASSPGQASPNAPVRLTQGEKDLVIPASLTHYFLLPQECAWGFPVQYAGYGGEDHDTINFKGRALREDMAWISDRFAGIPAPSSC